MGNWILLVVANVLLMTTIVHTINSLCPEAAAKDKVSCGFSSINSFCSWENAVDDNFNWSIGWTLQGFYAVARMPVGWSGGQYAILRSSLQCSTGNAAFKLSYYYYNKCPIDACALSVIIQTQNESRQIKRHQTPTVDSWQRIEIDNLTSPAATFKIIFKAEVLSWGTWHSHIDIANIDFKRSGATETTAQTTRTRATATATPTTVLPTATTATTMKNKSDSQTGSNEDTEGINIGIAIGITVSLLATGAFVAVVVVVIIRRRKGGNTCGFGSLRLLHCFKKKRKPDQSAFNLVSPGVVSSTNAQVQEGSGLFIVTPTSNDGDMYAKVNKKTSALGDRNTQKQTTHSTPSGTLNYELAVPTSGESRKRNDAGDCYCSQEDTSTHRQKLEGASGYVLANVKQSNASSSTSLNAPALTIATKPAPKCNDSQNEYNKLSRLPHHATLAGYHTYRAYDHLDENLKTVPEQLTSSSEYSLARMSNTNSKLPTIGTSDDHVINSHMFLPSLKDGKHNYVNVNPDITTPPQTTEAEYNRLDLDRPQQAKDIGLEKADGQDVYSHLHDEDGEYHQVAFDRDNPKNVVEHEDNKDGHDVY